MRLSGEPLLHITELRMMRRLVDEARTGKTPNQPLLRAYDKGVAEAAAHNRYFPMNHGLRKAWKVRMYQLRQQKKQMQKGASQ